jgi:glycosyltransferase involved in cell wall biosynthesis
VLRVTHFGNVGPEAGGIASVLRNYEAWTWERAHLNFVNTFSPHAKLFGAMPYLKALRRLLFTSAPQLGVVHVHLSQRGSYLREGSLVRLARVRGLPTCVTLHGSSTQDFLARSPRLVLGVLGKADAILALSGELVQHLKQVHGLRQARVVPNGMQVPPEPDRRPSQCPPTAVFAGAVTHRKGVDTLLSAWTHVVTQLPSARLLVVGPDGDVMVAPQEGMERLEALPNQEVLTQLAVARVAVLPSRAEGMPIFLLEAMSRARPVVTTRVGGIPDLVDETCGTFVDPDDPDAVAAALLRYLLEPGRADAHGRAGRTQVLARYAAPIVQAQLESVWEAVAAAGGAGR